MSSQSNNLSAFDVIIRKVYYSLPSCIATVVLSKSLRHNEHLRHILWKSLLPSALSAWYTGFLQTLHGFEPPNTLCCIKRSINVRYVEEYSCTCDSMHNTCSTMRVENKEIVISRIVKGAVSGKILCLVLVSVDHRIKTDRQSVFSFSITCLVLQIFTVLIHANSLCCHLLMHTKYKLNFTKREISFKLTSRIYSNFTRV